MVAENELALSKHIRKAFLAELIACTDPKRELSLKDRKDSVAKPQQGGKWGISLLHASLLQQSPFSKT